MKRFICLTLSLVITALCIFPAYALECAHEYTGEHFEKNCISPAYTEYTCALCGSSYKAYDWEYEAPQDFAIAYESEKSSDGQTLTVTAVMYNNPGLFTCRTKVSYNGEAIRLKEFINGDVWEKSDYTGGVFTENNPFSVYTENIELEDNTKSGLYYTLVFDILDESCDYGFVFTALKADMCSYDLTKNSVRIIDKVGKKEKGSHTFGEPVTVTEATFFEEGTAVRRCIYCDEALSCTIPVIERYKKGDLNNDTKINVADMQILKSIIIGRASEGIQQTDAADINSDGKINTTDSLYGIMLVLGRDLGFEP